MVIRRFGIYDSEHASEAEELGQKRWRTPSLFNYKIISSLLGVMQIKTDVNIRFVLAHSK